MPLPHFPYRLGSGWGTAPPLHTDWRWGHGNRDPTQMWCSQSFADMFAAYLPNRHFPPVLRKVRRPLDPRIYEGARWQMQPFGLPPPSRREVRQCGPLHKGGYAVSAQKAVRLVCSLGQAPRGSIFATADRISTAGTGDLTPPASQVADIAYESAEN